MTEVPHELTSATSSSLGVSPSKNPVSPMLLSAYTEGRLTVCKESQLYSPEGVEIKLTGNAILMIIPDPPTRTCKIAPSTRATTGSTDRKLKWEGGEHTYIGNSATLYFAEGETPASLVPLYLPNGLALYYGQIVALGGDFYGLPDAPISDDPNPPSRFIQAFNTLAVQSSSVAEAKKILQIMQIEIDAVNTAIHNGQQPSTAYAQLGDSLSAQWNVATGGGSAISDWVPLGRYLKLAATNWDHFGTHAVTVYRAGHTAAMNQAIAARNAPDEATKRAKLEVAYAMNAFADHFLSDIFSSGHMRTPRKELYETVNPKEAGSFLARFMHDEDCCWGLNVHNARNQQWKAYGDKKFLDTVNQANATIVKTAIQVSVDEIYAAYTSGTTNNSMQVLNYIPNLSLVSDWTQQTNYSPLFIYKDGTTQRRNDPSNRYDYSWTANWWGWSTMALLSRLDEFKACGNKQIPFELNTNIIQLWNNGGSLGMIVYSPQPQSGYGMAWSNPNMGAGSGAVAWLTGDMNGDGKTDIIQLWDNGGSLGMIVYSPQPQSGYGMAWSNPNMGEGSGAVAWLASNAGDNSNANIIQLWNNNGRLGLIVYSPNSNGVGYMVKGHSDDLGAGSGAVAWFTAEVILT